MYTERVRRARETKINLQVQSKRTKLLGAWGIGFDRYDLTDTSVWLHIKPILSVTSGKYIDTPLIQK